MKVKLARIWCIWYLQLDRLRYIYVRWCMKSELRLCRVTWCIAGLHVTCCSCPRFWFYWLL